MACVVIWVERRRGSCDRIGVSPRTHPPMHNQCLRGWMHLCGRTAAVCMAELTHHFTCLQREQLGMSVARGNQMPARTHAQMRSHLLTHTTHHTHTRPTDRPPDHYPHRTTPQHLTTTSQPPTWYAYPRPTYWQSGVTKNPMCMMSISQCRIENRLRKLPLWMLYTSTSIGSPHRGSTTPTHSDAAFGDTAKSA